MGELFILVEIHFNNLNYFSISYQVNINYFWHSEKKVRCKIWKNREKKILKMEMLTSSCIIKTFQIKLSCFYKHSEHWTFCKAIHLLTSVRFHQNFLLPLHTCKVVDPYLFQCYVSVWRDDIWYNHYNIHFLTTVTISQLLVNYRK